MTRLVTYISAAGAPRAGIVRETTIVDIQETTGGQLSSSLLEILETKDWLSVLRRSLRTPVAGLPLSETQLLAPLLRPPKILAAAANYKAHIEEIEETAGSTIPETPRLFLKPSSSLLGHDQTLILPESSGEVDWELELALVIGKPGANIPVRRALDFVAGYSIFNDISARSVKWDGRIMNGGSSFFDWLLGKWPDGFAPMGPWLVTADAIEDPQRLSLKLSVNGVVRQEGSTSEMLFSCAELISFASAFMTLEPGDIIATGTLAGTGASKGLYLRPGDVMEAEIEGVGMLRTYVGDRS